MKIALNEKPVAASTTNSGPHGARRRATGNDINGGGCQGWSRGLRV